MNNNNNINNYCPKVTNGGLLTSVMLTRAKHVFSDHLKKKNK